MPADLSLPASSHSSSPTRGVTSIQRFLSHSFLSVIDYHFCLSIISGEGYQITLWYKRHSCSEPFALFHSPPYDAVIFPILVLSVTNFSRGRHKALSQLLALANFLSHTEKRQIHTSLFMSCEDRHVFFPFEQEEGDSNVCSHKTFLFVTGCRHLLLFFPVSRSLLKKVLSSSSLLFGSRKIHF